METYVVNTFVERGDLEELIELEQGDSNNSDKTTPKEKKEEKPRKPNAFLDGESSELALAIRLMGETEDPFSNERYGKFRWVEDILRRYVGRADLNPNDWKNITKIYCMAEKSKNTPPGFKARIFEYVTNAGKARWDKEPELEVTQYSVRELVQVEGDEKTYNVEINGDTAGLNIRRAQETLPGFGVNDPSEKATVTDDTDQGIDVSQYSAEVTVPNTILRTDPCLNPYDPTSIVETIKQTTGARIIGTYSAKFSSTLKTLRNLLQLAIDTGKKKYRPRF